MLTRMSQRLEKQLDRRSENVWTWHQALQELSASYGEVFAVRVHTWFQGKEERERREHSFPAAHSCAQVRAGNKGMMRILSSFLPALAPARLVNSDVTARSITTVVAATEFSGHVFSILFREVLNANFQQLRFVSQGEVPTAFEDPVLW